jgi:hypothetical protein
MVIFLKIITVIIAIFAVSSLAVMVVAHLMFGGY